MLMHVDDYCWEKSLSYFSQNKENFTKNKILKIEKALVLNA